MIKVEDKLQCTGCSACKNICTRDAISMVPDEEGFLYPQVDISKCINCNLCNKVCSYNNEWEPKVDLRHCYVGYNIDEEARCLSSSGAIFVLLAEKVIKENGVVIGASYDEEFSVVHSKAENREELKPLLGSKYLQSDIGTIYRQIEQFLHNDRRVLFVGTTCQVAGLKLYLRKEYEKLLCVDFICLGIPSPLIWKTYLETYFHNEKIVGVNFKSKERGWHTFSLAIDTNKRHVSKDGKSTFFFTGYFKGLYSRPCCSECIFKGNKNRISDITLSDSWGCEKFAAELDDNKGLSNIIIHNTKGHDAFLAIKNNLKYKEVEFDIIVNNNKNYYFSLPIGKKREQFWNDYYQKDKDLLFRKYCVTDYNIKKLYRSFKLRLRKFLGK